MKKSGFTIIEVSLVLAIAGLIFLMAFIAFPSLQRTQRDAKRREDVLLLLERVKEYQRNNRGALPSSEEVWNSLFNDSFKDPSGEKYDKIVSDCGGQVGGGCSGQEGTIQEIRNGERQNTMLILRQATCDGSMVEATSNPRKIAVLYKLEGGGEFCANT